MRIIIDTNIFIPLEDSSIEIESSYSKLSRLVSGQHELIIHPASIDDIKRDRDISRRSVMLSRIEKYNHLEDHPIFENGEENHMFGKPGKENDAVDNLILLAILRNCAHLFITEDNNLLKKARAKGVGDSVLTISQACDLLDKQSQPIDAELANIKDVFCYSLDLENSIFNSLREAYNGFNEWYSEKCAKSGRKAWLCGKLNEIHAFCIYKKETNPVVTNDSKALDGSGLKLCTLKVDRNGLKLGELLIKQAFDYADVNNMDFVYLTVHEENHPYLVQLITDFGFSFFGIDTNGRDSVYVKYFLGSAESRVQDLVAGLSPIEFDIKYYPAVYGEGINSYLIPVQPQFHDRLFPDLMVQQQLFVGYEDPVGNAIKQAYICRTPTNTVSAGDIIFFYRTSDQKCVTTYGIVERFLTSEDSETILNLVKRRTVYPIAAIESMNSDLGAKVILFRRVRHLDKNISFQKLKELNIVSGPIQSLLKLDQSKIKILVNEARINDCFLPN